MVAELSILASFPDQLLPCASVVWLRAVESDVCCESWDGEGEGWLLTFVSSGNYHTYIFLIFMCYIFTVYYILKY